MWYPAAPTATEKTDVGCGNPKQVIPSTIEAMSSPPPGIVSVFTKQNLFAKAVHSAFFDHHPLILSPDIIWLTIAQGLAHHIDQNAETLRDKFVYHEGKKDLSTRKAHNMAFFGGVTCLVQHENGAIEPKVGWAVMDSGVFSTF